MNRRNFVSSILMSVCALFFLTPAGFAQIHFKEEAISKELEQYKDIKGIRIGRGATLKAAISQEGQYDDNIFLTATDAKHDLISITSPRFLLDLPFGGDARHALKMIYAADIGAFSNYKSENYVNQGVLAALDLKLPFGYVNVKNAFRDTVDRASTEFTSQVRRNENLSQVIFGVNHNKLSYEAGYSHFLADYRKNEFEGLNYNEDIFSGTVFYQIQPKTRALLEYGHGLINYSNDQTRDGDYNQVRTGFKFDLTGKTNGTVKAGYQQRDYDEGNRSGFNGFVAEGRVNTDFSERTSLSLGYLGTAVESISTNNNYYDMDRIGADLSQQLIGNFSVLVSAQYERRDYPEVEPGTNVERRDSVWTEGISLQYKLKDLGKASLGYQYTTDHSNIDENDYKDNLISLRFDFLI